MPYLGHEQIIATDAVKTIAALTIPSNTTWAELQATTNGVRYTMDGATDPAVGVGMRLLATESPKFFRLDQLKNIRFIRDGGSNADLDIHYGAGRNI